MSKRLLGLLLTGSVFFVAACGGGGNSSADFNDTDVTFAQGMIPHHEQAIEMAEIALDPKVSASTTVKDLASKIKQAQDPEIKQMTALLVSWKKPTQMNSSGGHDMSSMEGMMSDTDMKALGAASSTTFDQMWLTMMVKHHQGAIAMAKTVQQKGKNAEIKNMSNAIISAQQAEIDQMKKAGAST